jgi:hypothetical protein
MLELPPSSPAAAIVGRLREAGVTSDHRGQTLRLSPGIVTTGAGCDRLEVALGEALRG